MGAGSVGITILATALDQNVSLQCIFAGEALVAMSAWKRFHRQMDSLVSLQVMIAIETLGTLIALERTIWDGRGKAMGLHVTSIKMMAVRYMPAVETR